ncbi:MAG TPA: class I SAM-dependent methyltransferase [Nitrospirota bacterium]|nr:class I SAM-dependent methyltransferase [Nitrospirota bacterium]
MQNPFAYHQTPDMNPAPFVRERRSPYTDVFDAQVDSYMDFLKRFELKCTRRDADKAALLEELTRETDAMMALCDEYEAELKLSDHAAIKKARLAFRKKTDPMMSKSYLINRCRTWPQGHQGDYMTLELAYKNTPMSQGIGYYLDKYLLTTELAVGVRERREKLRDLILAELLSRTAPNVLDVACGSCREVFELSPEIKSSGAQFTCVDIDTDALDFSRDRLKHTGILTDHVQLITYNALRMFDPHMARAEFGMRDLIYSLGFFDYLPDEFLVKMLRSLYLMLNPGGTLIAAFKEATAYRPHIYHWLVDWDEFLQRTEKDFVRIMREAGIPDEAVTTHSVGSGTILFYSAARL